MFRSALVLIVLLTLPLRANLGETVEQCVKRYGSPRGFSEANAKSPFGTLGFVAGGYTLVIFLLDNKEVGARVSKTDKSAFSDTELNTIMAADASTPWTATESSDPTSRTWSRADKATALYDKDKRLLIFTSPAMADAVNKMQAKPSAPAASAPVTAPASIPMAKPVFAPAPTSSSAFPPPAAPSPSPDTGK